MADPGQDTAPFSVRSDKPVEVHNPIRRLRILAVLVVAAIILSSFAAGFIGYRLADASMNRRVSALEADRARVTEQRTEQIQQLRDTACVILNRLPEDPQVDQQRALYGCGPFVPQPSPAPGPTGGVSPTLGGSGQTAGALPAAPPARGSNSGPAPAPPPAPTPRPTPPRSPTPVPSPSPTPGRGGIICLPIVGCLL